MENSERKNGGKMDGRKAAPLPSLFPSSHVSPLSWDRLFFFSNLFSKLSGHQWFCENHTCCHPQTGYATVENSQKKKSREILRVEFFATKHGFVVGEKSLVYPQLSTPNGRPGKVIITRSFFLVLL